MVLSAANIQIIAPGKRNVSGERPAEPSEAARATGLVLQGTRSLRELAEGDVVRMKPFRLGNKVWKKATVRAQLDERSYVETPDGGAYRRTRCDRSRENIL